VSAPNPILQKGNYPMHPREDLYSPSEIPQHHRGHVPVFGDTLVGGKPIGKYLGTWMKFPIQKGPYLLAGNTVHFLKTYMPTALGLLFHCHQNRHLALGTSPPLSRLLPSTNIGVVQFHNPPEGVAGVPVLHGLSDLVAPTPRGRITQSQVSLNLTGRRSRCACSHQKDGPKPVPRGLSGLVKYGIGGKRCLMTTPFALVEPSLLYDVGLIVATSDWH